MIDLPEFKWPLHEMLFYRSNGSQGKYLICARGPATRFQYDSVIILVAEFDNYIEQNSYLDEIVRLQALTKALLR